MAQANCIPTAIRELLSREPAPNSTSAVRPPDADFLAAVAGDAPRPIYPHGRSEEFGGRIGHLEKPFIRLGSTTQKIPRGRVDRHCVGNVLHRLPADALCAIGNPAEKKRYHENWRAL